MNVEERLALVKQVGEEIVTEDELRALLTEKPHPIAYDGFEPSGTIHIAQGVLRAINVNKMTRAGVRFKMFVADWHAWANNKMGGDLDKIQTTGHYIVEIWKATGMDLQHVKFVWASEFVTDEGYWKKVMNIARDSSLDRILRTTQIMGRSDKDKLSASQILYPCMQAADIFHLEADITQLGMDQRKVNMLAREVGPKLGFWKPLVVSHHMLAGLQQAPPKVEVSIPLVTSALSTQLEAPLGSPPDLIIAIGHVLARLREIGQKLEGQAGVSAVERAMSAHGTLTQDYWQKSGRPQVGPIFAAYQSSHAGAKILEEAVKGVETSNQERATAMKMSKSNPDSAIFMTDSPEQVTKKLNKAFCPEKTVEDNPVMEYYRYIIFQRHWANHATAHDGESPVTMERPEKFGGNVTFDSYAALAVAYAEGSVHPGDLKKTAAKYINEILQPVREHFEKDERAKALKAQVDAFKVTR